MFNIGGGGGGAGAAGGAGGAAGSDGGGIAVGPGGKGGDGGANGSASGTAFTNSATLQGGNGVDGADAPAFNFGVTTVFGGGGGGGGAGGAGAYVNISGTSVNTGTIIGGNGGNGGAGGVASGGSSNNIDGNAGNGGDGGIGVYFGANASGAILQNISGTITGGAGGTGAVGGNGAAGVVGASITVLNSGTIGGGAGAAAISFTGGLNALTTNTGGFYTGAINVANSATLNLAQTTAAGATGSTTYANVGQFTGGGALQVSTDANTSVTIAANNSGFTGTTLVTAGSTLVLAEFPRGGQRGPPLPIPSLAENSAIGRRREYNHAQPQLHAVSRGRPKFPTPSTPPPNPTIMVAERELDGARFAGRQQLRHRRARPARRRPTF